MRILILFTLKNAIFFNFYPLICKFLQFFPQKVQILTIFPQNNAIFGNFFLNFFTIFLPAREKIDFSGRIFTYGTKKCVQLIMSSNVNRLLKTNVPMEVLRPNVRSLMGRLVQQFMMKFVRMLYPRNVMTFTKISAPRLQRKCAR